MKIVGPIDQQFPLGGRQPGFGMPPFVGGERHRFLGNLVRNLVEFIPGSFRRVRGEFRKIQMRFSIFHMPGQPPAHRLDFGVPRITRPVRMTVVTRVLEHAFHLGRNGKFATDIGGVRRRGNVFRRPDKLRQNQQNAEAEHDFLDHAGEANKALANRNGTFRNPADYFAPLAKFSSSSSSLPVPVADELPLVFVDADSDVAGIAGSSGSRLIRAFKGG